MFFLSFLPPYVIFYVLLRTYDSCDFFKPFYSCTILFFLSLFLYFVNCSIKSGKIVIILAGRFAGKKAVVVNAFDATKKRPFQHVLVAGLAKSPLQVSKTQSKKKIIRRSRVKAFCKYINVNHVMVTRYSVSDIDLKTVVVPTKVDKLGEARKTVVKAVRDAFSKKYLERSGKNVAGVQYFFQKLRF